MSPEIAETYGNKVRFRVCGLCWLNKSLLMINHNMGNRDFWAPPGGGVEFGEPLETALQREFLEETGLMVSIGKFLFGCEFIKRPLHAIELFFDVKAISGVLQAGYDPEIQLIEKAQFLSPEEIRLIPPENLHGIFRNLKDSSDLLHLAGFYRI